MTDRTATHRDSRCQTWQVRAGSSAIILYVCRLALRVGLYARFALSPDARAHAPAQATCPLVSDGCELQLQAESTGACYDERMLLADGTRCGTDAHTGGGLTCTSGRCLPLAVCGDGVRQLLAYEEKFRKLDPKAASPQHKACLRFKDAISERVAERL